MTRQTYMPVCVAAGSIVLRGDASATQYPFAVVPQKATAELNSYRQADTFDLEFDAERFPFHTDDIRSMAVELYMFERRTMGDDLGALVAIRTPLVVGRVDEAGIELSDGGRTFHAAGKDYTEQLLAHKWDAKRQVAPGGSLVGTVQKLIDEALSATGGGSVLRALYIAPFARRGTASSPPVVQGSGGRSKGLTWPSGVTYWDVITDLCAASGKRVAVRGLDVVISAPADIIEGGDVFEAGDGTVDMPNPRSFAMAWGRNIIDLDITKKAGGERTPQQVFKSYDSASRQTLVARYPDVRSDSDPEAVVRLVHGVSSLSDLAEMARTTWHEISRGESELEFTTADLTDLHGKSLLDLRPADSMRIDYDPLRRDELAKLTPADRYRTLVAAGFGDGVAQGLAANFASMERWNRLYYVTRVGLSWDAGTGVEIKVGASNFLGQRAETQLQPESLGVAA
jgi:hypothetical protein